MNPSPASRIADADKMDADTLQEVFGILDCDDGLLLQILSHPSLSLQDTLNAARSARNFNQVCSASEDVWAGLLQRDFGVCAKGTGLRQLYRNLHMLCRSSACHTPRPSGASTSSARGQSPGSSAHPRRHPPVLHFKAVATDQGVDMPWGAFWADNLLRPSSQHSLFCTEAGTRDAHVLGVLQAQSDQAELEQAAAEQTSATTALQASLVPQASDNAGGLGATPPAATGAARGGGAGPPGAQGGVAQAVQGAGSGSASAGTPPQPHQLGVAGAGTGARVSGAVSAAARAAPRGSVAAAVAGAAASRARNSRQAGQLSNIPSEGLAGPGPPSAAPGPHGFAPKIDSVGLEGGPGGDRGQAGGSRGGSRRTTSDSCFSDSHCSDSSSGAGGSDMAEGGSDGGEDALDAKAAAAADAAVAAAEAAAAAQEAAHAAAQLAEREAQAAHRLFLLRRLTQPAAYMLRAVAEAVHMQGHGRGGSGSGQGAAGGPLPWVAAETLDHAREVLKAVSTKGLEDLYSIVYRCMTSGEGWARAMLRGVRSDEDIQEIHTMAWEVLHTQHAASSGQGTSYSVHPLPDRPAPDRPGLCPGSQGQNQRPGLRMYEEGGAAAAERQLQAAAHAVAQVHRRQQRSRDLSGGQQADVLLQGRFESQGHAHQAGTASGRPHPQSQQLGLIQGVVVDRCHTCTCPVRSGAVFAGFLPPHQAQGQQPPAAVAAVSPRERSSDPSPRPSARSAEAGVASQGHAAPLQHLADELLHGTTKMAWVQALSSLDNAQAVLAAAAAGALPPVYNYFTSEAGEWIEFDRLWTTSTAEADDSSQQGQSLRPLLWFRFFSLQELESRQRQASVRQALQEVAHAAVAEMIQAVAVHDAPGSAAHGPGGDAHGQQAQGQGQAQGLGPAGPASTGASGSGAGRPTGAVAHTAASASPAVEPVPAWDWPAVAAHLKAEQQGAGATTAPGPVPSQPQEQQTTQSHPQPVPQPAASATSAHSGALPETADSADHDEAPWDTPGAPVEVGRGMWEASGAAFPIMPYLTCAAPEAAFAFGWGTDSAPGTGSMLHMRLHQPCVADTFLVKLISAEDFKPAFNAARGGCNIDAAFVVPLGWQLAVPDGCAVVGLS